MFLQTFRVAKENRVPEGKPLPAKAYAEDSHVVASNATTYYHCRWVNHLLLLKQLYISKVKSNSTINNNKRLCMENVYNLFFLTSCSYVNVRLLSSGRFLLLIIKIYFTKIARVSSSSNIITKKHKTNTKKNSKKNSKTEKETNNIKNKHKTSKTFKKKTSVEGGKPWKPLAHRCSQVSLSEPVGDPPQSSGTGRVSLDSSEPTCLGARFCFTIQPIMYYFIGFSLYVKKEIYFSTV